ncbi:hypothetical protein BGZ83_002697 [Gryganskiella cystojenkinii]|nr:hypothetical protein BGZ83_002697 [Gryganskiella cystojenkinii]
MARKNRQRIPLQQANGAPTGATVSNNFYSSSTSKGPSQSSTSSSDPQRISTSSSLSTSSNASYPMIPSSSTTSIASISSIPSITSNESASTITPSSSASSSALPRPASNARNTSSNSNSNLNGALATGPTTPGSGGGGVSARGGARSVGSKQRASNPDYTNDRSSSANGSESMLLPRLPSLEDFDIPFLNSDSFSSSISSSSFSPSPTTTFSSSFTSFLPSTSTSPPGSSSSSAYSRPLLSSFAPTSSQYLTSQSSRVQDFHHSPPNSNSTPVRNTRPSVLSGISSNHSNSSIRSNLQQQQQQRPPSMYSQTTIDATGTILQQQGPLELTRLEASDYFIHNTNEDFLPKKLTVRSASSRNTEDNSIHSNNSSIHTNNNDPLDARGRTQRSDDLLSPPRYVIRQPSLSGLSKASRATSPSPSLTSSVLSDDSSVHSSLQHHQQLQQLRHQRQPQRPILDTPTSQQQTSQSIPSGTVRASQPTSPNQTTRPTSTPTSPASPASLQPPKEASLQAKAFLSPASSSASASAAVSPASVSTSGSKRVKAIKQQQQAVEPDTPSSPNLRARISKLFRQSPKQPRPTSSTSSTDQQQERYRDQSKELQQNTAATASAAIESPAGAAATSDDHAVSCLEKAAVFRIIVRGAATETKANISISGANVDFHAIEPSNKPSRA